MNGYTTAAGRRRGRDVSVLVTLIAVTAMLASLLTVVVGTVAATPSHAASASGFHAGDIIDDATFFDSTSMTASQVQAFLNAKVKSCNAKNTCLKSYQQTTRTIAADSHCSKYTGAKNQKASTIIVNVAKACGISPKVLLVTLQKEQGLVTSTAPTTSKYKIAMGFACPDTAGCDSRYYGFFNQVYNAARQFDVYVTNPNLFNYAAGRTSSILYSPTRSCGSSKVKVANAATAALYNYTPYQPNTAALKNLYGVGNGCSSYGNRNFWVFFTDWFGSTHKDAGRTMVRADGTPEVYIIGADDKLHHIPDKATQKLFMPLGPTRVVSKAYLAGFSKGIDIGPVVRDAQSHVVALVQNGQMHRFDSCARVALWGTTCGNYVNLTAAQSKLLPTGAEVSDFYSVDGGSAYNMIHDGVGYPVENAAAVKALNGGSTPFIGVMPANAVKALKTGHTLLAPGTLVHGSSSSTPYLVTGLSSVARVTDSAYPTELGVTGAARSVSDSVLKPYLSHASTLGLLATCGSSTYIANSGRLTRLASGNHTGLSATPMDSYGCAALTRAGTITGNVYVGKAGTSSYSLLTGGKLRAIGPDSTAVTLNDGRAITVVRLGAKAYATLPKGGGLVAPTSAVKKSGHPEVYIVDGFTGKYHLPSWTVAKALGLASHSRTVPDATVDGYPTHSADLSLVVRCGSSMYFGDDGVLRRVSSAGGLPVTPLETSSCAQLDLSSAAAAKTIWIKSTSGKDVYEVVDGKRRWVPDADTWTARNGGKKPGPSWRVSDAELASIPLGAPLVSVDTPKAGTLIRAQHGKDVYLVVDGTRKLHLPDWATAHALGLDRYRIVADNTVTALGTIHGSLHRIVTCGSTEYFGARGTLYAIDPKNAAGLGVTSLDATTCRALSLSKNAAARQIWIRQVSTPDVYEIVNGKRRWVPDGATWTALNDGAKPGPSWVVGADELASFPQGPAMPKTATR